jgi:hypothetical protein
MDSLLSEVEWNQVNSLDPSQSYPSSQNFISVLPSIIDLVSNILKGENDGKLLDEKAFKRKANNVLMLNKRFDKGQYTECQYKHLVAIALGTKRPQCVP